MGQKASAAATPPLWYDCDEDAIRDAVHALGGTKAVAAQLWPERPVAQSQALLSDCMNTDRPAKLSLAQIILIGKSARAIGHHGLMRYIAMEMGYEEPRPTTPDDQRAELQREFMAATKLIQQLGQKMERLSA